MKKHISLALSIIMLLTSILSISVIADTTTGTAQSVQSFTDVTKDTKYYEAIITLSKLKVINGYEDGTFKPEGNITRAEFTKMVTYTLGLEGLMTPPTEFTDVNDHWAKYNIKTAYDLGIINGMGDGTFAPDANVTYEQALKMVVCMLGYKTYAEQAGGYPEGYHAQAAALKLIDDISGLAYDAPATRGAIAQLLYNALEVPMKMVDAKGSVVDADETLLNDHLNVYRLEGILVGVEDYVTGDNTETLNLGEMNILSSFRDEGEIVINFSEYTKSVTDISKYLGKLITVYYQEIEATGEKKLMILDDESNENAEYQITFDQLDSFNGEYLRYYEDGNARKTKSLKFNIDEITVRYNGKVVQSDEDVVLTNTYIDDDGIITTDRSDEMSLEEALSEWLDPSSDFFIYGDITLTDRKADGVIDDVQINDYNTIVAYKAPTTTDYKIADKIITGNGLILDPNSMLYTYTIVKNGTQIPITSVAAGDIVLYAESLDGDLYTCVIESKTVSGTITSFDRTEREIYIDGTMYNLGEMFEKYISTNQDGKTIATGQTGTFYVDKYNTIVYGTIAEEKTKPYAYITNTYESEDNTEHYLAAYIPSKATSGTQNYKIREKVKVNGTSMKDSEAVAYLKDLSKDEIAEGIYYNNNDINNEETKTKIYGSSADAKLTASAQVARLEINSDNEISEIITITDDEDAYNEDGTTNITTNEDTTKIVRCKDLTQYNYTSSSFTISNKSQFSINSSTTIIYVPADRSMKSDYAKKTTSSFTSTEKYYVEAYDISSSKVAGLVILYGTSGSMTEVSKTTDFSIVAKAPQLTYDEAEDENKLTLSVYAGTSSAIKNWTTKDEREFSDVTVGDVIQFAYDQDRYAQDRVDIIKYADIEEVLEGKTVEIEDEEGSHTEKFNWTEAPEDEDAVQTEMFNYRFPKANTSANPFYETYTSSTLGTIPYSRACMYNVYQIQEENNKLLVTQGGFAVNEDGDAENVLYNTDDYEEITISSSTKIIRMESNKKEFSPYVEDTETAMTYRDLKAAQNYGADCSKILVCSLRGSARLIVVYE